VAAQRGADRSRRDSYTKSLELALDALVAPARVLLGETDDQLLDVVVKRWSPLSMMRVGPRALLHLAISALDGLHWDT
jgi:hypothetical protein